MSGIRSRNRMYEGSSPAFDHHAVHNVPPDSAKTDRQNPLTVFVMGATGSGKSTFINLVSGCNLATSNSQHACTQDVDASANFVLDGRKINLIDTPGFDDTSRSEMDILKAIAAYLEAMYRKHIVPHGIIYLHRISDIRYSGSVRRCVSVLEELCGRAALGNVVISTTMWHDVSQAEGDDREAQLADKFHPFVSAGAKLLRHNRGLISAQNIVRAFFNTRPIPFAIQTELVQDRKLLAETGAGRAVMQRYQNLEQDLVRQFNETRAEMVHIIQERERRRLANDLEELERLLNQVRTEAGALQAAYEDKKRQMQGAYRRSSQPVPLQVVERPRFWRYMTITTSIRPD